MHYSLRGSNMRILFIVHQFFPKWYTGTERFVLNLAKQLQKMGHYVEVLTYGFEDLDEFSFQNGVMVKRYKYQDISVISVRHYEIPNNDSFVLDIYTAELEPMLNDIIKKGKYDVIHVAHPLRLASAIKVSARAGIPIVLTLTDFWLICPRVISVTSKGELCRNSEGGIRCIHDCFGDSYKNKLINRRFAISDIIKNTDCMVAATNSLKQIFEENYPELTLSLVRFGEDYSDVVPNLRKYSKDSLITLGFLSTLQPLKGAHILLEAFKKANSDNIRIKVYGHHFYNEEYYKNLTKNYEDIVEFCGEYRYEDMPIILNDIDMIVIPSLWWENSPLVLLRALAHNVPAIVSDLGGMTEIIKDGENGFVFEAGNVESLAEILEKLGRDPTILNEMKANNRHPPRIEEEAFEYELIYSNLFTAKNI